jgi:hypothetical protein
MGVFGCPGGVPVWCAAALSLDVGQAFGEATVSDPDDVHAAHMSLAPVVASAHHGALGAV